MDRQRLFNDAYLGLAKQGFQRSYDPAISSCMYRGPDNLKCAIGHCIPDDKMDLNHNAVSATHDSIVQILQEIYCNNGETISDSDKGFIRSLQTAHDLAHSPEEMKHDFENFANDRGLTIPKIV